MFNSCPETVSECLFFIKILHWIKAESQLTPEKSDLSFEFWECGSWLAM